MLSFKTMMILYIYMSIGFIIYNSIEKYQNIKRDKKMAEYYRLKQKIEELKEKEKVKPEPYHFTPYPLSPMEELFQEEKEEEIIP